MKYKVGDRFYFYRNLSTSESVQVGYKGIVDELMSDFICCDGWAFQENELKPIITLKAELA